MFRTFNAHFTIPDEQESAGCFEGRSWVDKDKHYPVLFLNIITNLPYPGKNADTLPIKWNQWAGER